MDVDIPHVLGIGLTAAVCIAVPATTIAVTTLLVACGRWMGTALARLATRSWLRMRRTASNSAPWDARDADAPADIADTVQRALAGQGVMPRPFPVAPGDDLRRVYGIGAPGRPRLNAMLERLAADCAIRLRPHAAEDARLRTVADVVKWLARQRERPAAEWPGSYLPRPAMPGVDALPRPAGRAAIWPGALPRAAGGRS